jgi:hypothetical protein
MCVAEYFAEYAEEVPAGETCRALSRAAADASVCVVGGSVPERCGERLYNASTVWDASGKLLAHHRKVCRHPLLAFFPLIIYIHTYHSYLIPEGVTEAHQIFLRDVHVIPK